ncbi:MAG TPA: hypothetical protein VGL44_05150 [Gaiellales bacterium]
MQYAVNATGDDSAHGPYESFDQAKERVRELDSGQFPATICEMPDDESTAGSPRVVSKYRSAPP